MAEIMVDIFGDLLYSDPRNENSSSLPSPASLRNKILIKGKKLKKHLEEDEDDEGDVSDEDEAADIDAEYKVCIFRLTGLA